MSMPTYSSGSGFSDSSTYPVQTPENDIINQLSGVAAGLANQMHSWAQGVFAQTSQITNQAVGNFFNVSQKMLGLSDNLTDQYNNVFAPQNRSLAAEADSYASPERMKIDMGQAGATQAQAAEAGRHNAEQALQSYGVNVNDGKYASLEQAAAVQNAANVAGAMNTQRNADIATGQKLRSEAVQVGAQLPAAISNVNNTAIQANTGASNASLANANVGRSLMALPNDYLKTAMDVKLPPMGSTQHQENKNSSGPGGGFSTKPDSGGSGHGGGGGQNGGGGGNFSGRDQGQAWMPEHGGGNPGMGGGYEGGSGPEFQQYGGQDQPFETGTGSVGEQVTDPFSDYGSPWGGVDYGGYYGGQDTQGYGGQSGQGEYYDANANATDPGWGARYDQPDTSAWDNMGNQNPDYSTDSSPAYDTSSQSSDYYAGDYAMGDNYDTGGAYAGGGAISGPLPPAMSPSGGQQTDDIQAQGPQGSQLRLDAGEFVIPQDVALWKGQEFFQKLIDSSRKLRMTAPAHGKPLPGAR